MKISHRIAARGDSPLWVAVKRMGLSFESGDITVLNIVEDSEHWPEVEQLCRRFELATHFVKNQFSKREMESAEWHVVSAIGHHGYPQPEDTYSNTVYGDSDICLRCGIGGVQKAAFRLKSEPKASRSQFFQLNWVFDEFFVREVVRAGLSEGQISGADFLAPIIHLSDNPSRQVVQLKIARYLVPALDTDGMDSEHCAANYEQMGRGDSGAESYCGQVKYHRMRRGPLRFERAAFIGVPDIVKSYEWFGSGGSAYRLVLVSKKFRELVLAMGWRGLGFEPVELV